MPPLSMGLFLAAMTLLLISVLDFMNELILSGVPMFPILKILLCLFPTLLEMALPIGCLLASMLVYGRLSEDREIVAMRSAGLSGFTLLFPALVLGMALTLFNFYWTGEVTPKSLKILRSTAKEMMENITSINIFKPGQFNSTPERDLAIWFSNNVPGTNSIENITIFISGRGQGFSFLSDETQTRDATNWTISAPLAVLKPIPAKGVLQLILKDCVTENLEPRKLSRVVIDNATLSIDIGRSLNKFSDEGLTKEKRTYRQFMALAEENREKFEISRRNLGFEEGASHGKILERASEWQRLKREDPASVPMSIYELIDVKDRIRDTQRYTYWAMQRFTYPAATFLFIMIGSSLGLIAGRGKKTVCFLITAFVLLGYYTMEKTVETISENLALTDRFDPGFLPWVPNLVLLIIGLILMRAVVRQ
ncbi:MAG: LptF/LptG family permease [Candidatus Omnitrophica bacterium]|nr:LptF/LptG family permease [Candidatus Omnitrophota bacterium]MCA9416142.1 LptF/LptG family permease [Candidatus Omnitrophota bacterium]MCA9424821.1 LptF/LptG family permease [Candidatus Omnitrophota bacterium]MCA9429784.1 LptF/LptG family permease [Candidatus Omnitrophota bacterium]MCA9434510.1 LptF/LptG family permease [Candidatus Omnitrophota bacterium]